jgi:hypothetical protein
MIISAYGNKQVKRIISETPVKSEILGLKLCSQTTSEQIETALSKSTEKIFFTYEEKWGIETMVRAVPYSLNFIFGGLNWNYIDIHLDQNSRIYLIQFVASFESLDKAIDLFNQAKTIYTNHYGKGNENDEQNIFWTDDINFIRLFYKDSATISGDDRSFCVLYYVNIELANAAEKANQPDI